jgi:hypothetical protein
VVLGFFNNHNVNSASTVDHALPPNFRERLLNKSVIINFKLAGKGWVGQFHPPGRPGALD